MDAPGFIPQSKVKLFYNPAGLQKLAEAVIIRAAQEAAAWLAETETADTWLHLAGQDWRSVKLWVAGGCKVSKSVITHNRLPDDR